MKITAVDPNGITCGKLYLPRQSPARLRAGVPCLLGVLDGRGRGNAQLRGRSRRARKIAETADFGLVLVEVFWSHDQLLGLPWFRLGPVGEGQIIHVWAFFPVSAAEPDIEF